MIAHSLVEEAILNETRVITEDRGSSAGTGGETAQIGCEVQGNLTGGIPISHSSTREPNAEELVSNLRVLLSTTLRDGTRRSYLRAWVVFRQFYAHFYGSTDPSLPLIPTCILLFISYLSFRKFAFSTITSYLAAISYVHKLFVIQPNPF